MGTTWNFNPLLPTSNIINYDSATEKYDNPKQPYDGIPGVTGTVVSGGGKLKMFLGLGFPLPAAGTKSAGHGIYSQILWKNPTAYKSSLIAGATQTYYGPLGEVPIFAAPTTWFANATPENLAGQYRPENNAYAKVRPYDIATLAYDSATTGYDGMNNDQSFNDWKAPTAWAPVTGGNDF